MLSELSSYLYISSSGNTLVSYTFKDNLCKNSFENLRENIFFENSTFPYKSFRTSSLRLVAKLFVINFDASVLSYYYSISKYSKYFLTLCYINGCKPLFSMYVSKISIFYLNNLCYLPSSLSISPISVIAYANTKHDIRPIKITNISSIVLSAFTSPYPIVVTY